MIQKHKTFLKRLRDIDSENDRLELINSQLSGLNEVANKINLSVSPGATANVLINTHVAENEPQFSMMNVSPGATAIVLNKSQVA